MSDQAGEQRREAEPSPPPMPRIYVASLSDYNDGRLHGAWLDAAQEVEVLYDQVDVMLKLSPLPGAEEWAIHDYESFGSFQLGEYEALEWISAVASGIVEHGYAFAAYAELVNDQPERLKDFDDAYRGQWESLEAYADELLDDLGATELLEQVPDWLQPYVSLDVAGFARDLTLGGDIWTAEAAEGGVWVFDGAM